MAVFQPAPGIAKVEMRFTHQAQKVENVFHVRQSGAATVASLTAIAELFKNAWRTVISTEVVLVATLDSVVVTDLSVVNGLAVVDTALLPSAGQRNEADLPMNVTIAISWHTGLAGKSFRGRTYHVGIPQSVTVGSRINAAYHTGLVNVYEYLRSNAASSGTPMVVLSRRTAKAFRANAIGTDITSMSLDDVLDSQRRRLPGRGS